MQVILKEDVAHLGKSGAVVTVKPGFARNYLSPQGLATVATRGNIKVVEQQVRHVQRQIDVARAQAAEAKERLGQLTLTLPKPVGENDRLFGSVTAKDIEAALVEKGVTVDRRRLVIDEPIRALGTFIVHVKLAGGVVADLKVEVTRK